MICNYIFYSQEENDATKRREEEEMSLNLNDTRSKEEALAAAQSHERERSKHYSRLGATFAIKSNSLQGRPKAIA